jgi:hypothetical protein
MGILSVIRKLKFGPDGPWKFSPRRRGGAEETYGDSCEEAPGTLVAGVISRRFKDRVTVKQWV